MKLVPLCSIGVQRDGQNVHPPVGVAFEFSAAEKADLDALSAKTNVDYYREPVNEVAEDGHVAEKPAKAVRAAKAEAL